MIQIKNDGKGNFQSFEAYISSDHTDSMSHHLLGFTGYGKTRYEALRNLKKEIDLFVGQVSEAFSEIEM